MWANSLSLAHGRFDRLGARLGAVLGCLHGGRWQLPKPCTVLKTPFAVYADVKFYLGALQRSFRNAESLTCVFNFLLRLPPVAEKSRRKLLASSFAPGDLFSLAAAMASVAVTSTYSGCQTM